MTAPVVTGPPPAEKIAMTAPVVSNQDFMQFILPHTFTRLEDIPTPQDDKILIKQIPEKVVAVSQFSGANDASYFVQRMKELKEVILEEEFVEKTALGPPCPESVTHANDIGLPENIPWSFAKYNPPFTLPPFRRNEVWVELPKEIQTEKLHALVEKASTTINPATTAVEEQTK
jgi:hypothetical protein